VILNLKAAKALCIDVLTTTFRRANAVIK